MKKIISALLCIIMAVSVTTVAYAQNEEIPVIFVPGYTSSRLYINRGTEDEKRVWKVDVSDELISAIKEEIPNIVKELGSTLKGDYTPLFKLLEPYANEITEYLRINDDGTSKYDVEVYPHSVETTRLDALDEYGYRPDNDTLSMLKNRTRAENIYCCTLDWRLGQIDNAKVLNDYVNDVLEATGAEKVNIIGVSYGGQVTASYLSIYGGDKVNNVVLHCPALDGSSISSQLLGGEKPNIAWSDLLKLIQTFRNLDTDYSEITDIADPEFFNGFIGEFINYYLRNLFLNFGSAWDLVPLDQYTELRDKMLNDGKHDSLIEKSDRYHFEIAAKRKEILQRLSDEGVHISIIAGYGSRLAVDNGMDSDAVIEVASATGAICSGFGKTLEEGYAAARCREIGHCHLSPNGCIDAATGYLPENTWFVDSMFHGLGTNETIVAELICDLLFTEGIADVHSNIKYPQFMTSDNAANGIFCKFSSCSQGFFTQYSTELIITNVSQNDNILIDGITAGKTDLKFNYSCEKIIAPGESVAVEVRGVTPSEDLSTFRVSVNYMKIKEDNKLVSKNRVQNFRFTNGSLYGEVLEDGIDENSPTIQKTDLQKNGIDSIKVIFARIGFYIKKLVAFFALKIKNMF